MNRLIITLIAMLGMALAGCSNDDLLAVDDLDDLDKLEKIENPTIIGYNNVHTVLTYGKDELNALPEIKEDGDYTVYVFNTAEELAEAEISGYSVPGIYFNPDFSKTELEDFRIERRTKTKSVSIIEDFSDIDWSKQSLVVITRKYPSTSWDLNNVSGKIYRKSGNFVIALQEEILSDTWIYGCAITYWGVAVLVDKPNLSAKGLRIHLDNTEYSSNAEGRYDKKTESKWLKL